MYLYLSNASLSNKARHATMIFGTTLLRHGGIPQTSPTANNIIQLQQQHEQTDHCLSAVTLGYIYMLYI